MRDLIAYSLRNRLRESLKNEPYYIICAPTEAGTIAPCLISFMKVVIRPAESAKDNAGPTTHHA